MGLLDRFKAKDASLTEDEKVEAKMLLEEEAKAKRDMKTMDSKKMLKKHADKGTVIKRNDRVKLVVLENTKFYREGQLINPHKIVANELIESGIAKKAPKKEDE